MIPPAASILVVDDEPMQLEMLRRAFERAGLRVTTAGDLATAIGEIDRAPFDIVITDTYLTAQPDGLKVLEHVRSRPLPPIVFLMSGRAELRLAVEAMRAGADDFLEKPCDLQELMCRIERAFEKDTMRRKLHTLEANENARATIVAESAAMRRVLDLADRVAASPTSSALIVGESGVGKEIVASRIHQVSRRNAAPFVKVNLAAMPESMVEADLFGSVRGAFTDAKRDRAGLLATANGGTILLDELCEFRVELQPKLLRVLEERKFFPVGSDHERSVDVRVLAATNRNPIEAIAGGRLRSDLYYRLSTMTIEVPPLRTRPDDILPLAAKFARQLSADFGRPPAHFTDRAKEALLAHSWPGNVRELRNAIERALMLSDRDEIDETALLVPSSSATPARPLAGGAAPRPLDGLKQDALETVERHEIARALEQAQGNRSKAAKLLGMSRTTLWEKAKRYGLKGQTRDD